MKDRAHSTSPAARAAAERRSRERAPSTEAVDLRPSTIAQRQLATLIGSSPRVAALRARADSLRASPRLRGMGQRSGGGGVVQRVQTVLSLVGLNAPADDDPIPVGRLLDDQDEGLQILERLGLGDRTVFAALGLAAPEDYMMQVHEWGLGHDRETGKYVIVRGGPGAVSFGKGVLAQVTGLSHTHPVPRENASAEVQELTFLELIRMAAMLGIDAVFAGYNSVFPSNTDVIANYTVGSRSEEKLFTPFRIDDAGRLSTEKGPFVSVLFGPAKATLRNDLPVLAAENTAIDYLYAPMSMFRGDQRIWQGVLQVATSQEATAWPKDIAVPEHAHHRDQNKRIIDAHNERDVVTSSSTDVETVPRLTPEIERKAPHERNVLPEMERVREFKTERKPEQRPREGKKRGGCFLTSACVHARGLPDDCHELTVLRAFRDGFMRSLPDGASLVDTYYRIAPDIVSRIQSDARCNEMFDEIYRRIVDSVTLIERGDNDGALQTYSAMVLDLDARMRRPGIATARLADAGGRFGWVRRRSSDGRSEW